MPQVLQPNVLDTMLSLNRLSPVATVQLIFLDYHWFDVPSLREELEQAQFDYVKIYDDKVPEFGIIWPISFALPIAARSHSK